MEILWFSWIDSIPPKKSITLEDKMRTVEGLIFLLTQIPLSVPKLLCQSYPHKHSACLLSLVNEFMNNFTYVNPFVPHSGLLSCYEFRICWLFSILSSLGWFFTSVCVLWAKGRQGQELGSGGKEGAVNIFFPIPFLLRHCVSYLATSSLEVSFFRVAQIYSSTFTGLQLHYLSSMSLQS